MNESVLSTNIGQLSGRVVKGPSLSHSAYKEDFYEVMLEVKRLSNNVDVIPLLVSGHMLQPEKFKEGAQISVTGEFRSYNKMVDNKSRLILYFFAKSILPQPVASAEQANILKLSGYICKQPVLRETPFGRQICDVLLAVNRNQPGRSDYIPCLTWGRNAYFAGQLPVGTGVEIEGRIQSRKYKKVIPDGVEERVAYEVSCKMFAVTDAPGTFKQEVVDGKKIMVAEVN